MSRPVYMGEGDCEGKFSNHGVDPPNGARGVFCSPRVAQIVKCSLVVQIKMGCLKRCVGAFF